MELWWIILAGCGGGLLLAAYVAVVVYKLFRRKKRVQMNRYQDPEHLTDDKDWAIHVHAREVSERRVDGLCMDTLSRSTTLRRKASIPSVNRFLGASEEVPNVPVDSSQTNSDDKQNKRSTAPSPQPQASAGFNQDASPYVVTAAERSSPKVVRRSEYTWETLLSQPSDVRIKRSQSFNWDDPEYKKPNGKTRSLKLASDRQGQVKRIVRSKSLRGYTHRELTVLGAAETTPFDKTVISVKRRDDNAKRNKSKKSPKTQKNVTGPGNKVTKAEGTKNKKINRSGSAPSVRAKEKVANTDVEGSLKRRHSSRWIPDPDYQAVSMEDLVSAAQQQVKATRKDNVCVVEIHNVPRDRAPKASTSSATSQGVDTSLSTSLQQSSRSHEVHMNSSTTGDLKTISPIPGAAKRVPTVLPNDQSPDKKEETDVSIKNTHEIELSVKNCTRNMESQIVDVQPNTGHSRATHPTRNYTADIGAPQTIDINNNSQTLPDWRPKQTARETTNETNIDSNQTGQPPLKTKPAVRSIGKLTLVKHIETPARGGNPEMTHTNPIRENPTKNFENASSIHMRQLTDTSSPRNVTLLVRSSNEQRENEASHVPFSAPPPPPFTVDSRSFRQVLDNEVKITIAPKDSQDAISVLKETNVPSARDTDVNLTLEERKKTWKREQILDQLHSARARNGNQNYIFGTGLAYQSCMPELQNKLKKLTLAK